MAGPAMPERVMIGMPMEKIRPVGARPNTAVPVTPQSRPSTITRLSPHARTMRPESPAWTTAEHTPKPVRHRLTVAMLQP